MKHNAQVRAYVPKVHYTPAELDAAAIADWLNDAAQSERQAEQGPFYPDKGITKESCLSYAAMCRAKAEQYKDGGAHRAMLRNG
jgi:hypothetical protein